MGIDMKKECKVLIASLGLLILSACTSVDFNSPEYKISKSLPQSELAEFNDSFDELREDYWLIGADVFVAEKLKSKFRPGKVVVKDGALSISTQGGYFGSGELRSTFHFVGDFDVQADFRAQPDPKQYKAAIMSMRTPDSSVIYSSLIYSFGNGTFSVSTLKNELQDGKRNLELSRGKQVSGGQGTFRMIKRNGIISYFYKNINEEQWTKLYERSISVKKMNIGFVFLNHSQNSAIPAHYEDSCHFDNLRINAAQEIEESDI
jgi:hypothetical protein